VSGPDDPLAPLRAQVPAPPSEDFVEAVMRQVATRPLPRVPWWRRLMAERELRLRVRPPLLLAAVAALALLVVVARPRPAAVVTVGARPGAGARAGAGVAAAPSLVRFALAAPGAHQVAVAGDFNGWRPDATPLERGPDGVWQTHVPLAAGNWSYSFVVDGRWVEDPLADTWRADGFGGRNAVVRVGDLPAALGAGGGG
jgi:hypothetical protein